MSYAGLQKQTVEVRLGGGIDEANHPFVVDSPSVLAAVNARYDHRGAIAKRGGATVVSGTGLPSTASAGENNSIHEHQDGVLVWSPSGAYAYNDLESKWARTNECAPRPSRVLTDSLIRTNESATLRMPDIAIVGNLLCAVWQDETNEEIKYGFYDATTLAMVAGPKTMGTSGMRRYPRVFAFDNATKFALLGQGGTGASADTIRFATYTISAGTYAFGAEAAITGSNSTAGEWDFAISSSSATTYHVAVRDSATSTKFIQCNASGATGTTKTATDFKHVALMHNTVLATIVAVGSGDTGGGTWTWIARFPDDYTGSVTQSLLFTPTGLTPSRGTIAQLDSTGKMFTAISGSGVGAVGDGGLVTPSPVGAYLCEVSTTYTSVRSALVSGMTVAAKAVYLGSDSVQDVMVALCQQSGLGDANGYAVNAASAVYSAAPYGVLCRPIVNAAGNYDLAIVGRYLQDKIDKNRDSASTPAGSNPSGYGHLSQIQRYAAGEYWFAATVITRLAPTANVPASANRRAIDLVRANSLKVPPVRSVTAQSLRLLAGGAGCSMYDGMHMAELTPPPAPVVWLSGADATIGPGTAVNSGGTAPGDKFVLRIVHRYIDAQGNVHRGAPSARWGPETVGTTNGKKLRFFVPPTALNGDRLTYLDTEVYQSNDLSPSEHHLCGVVKPKQESGGAWWYVTAIEGAVTGLPDHACNVLNWTVALAMPRLYTDTEAPNSPSPPLLDLVSTQNRLWGLSAEDRLSAWYTKPIVGGRAPEWSANLVQQIPHEGGDCVGLAALDDKVIVLKARKLFALFGDPGDANGDGSTLQPPRLISSDVGCSNVNSIVEGPFGVAFQSERGFYVLSRALELQFIGESVKDTLGSSVVTSGVLVPNQNEVRWTLDTDGKTWNKDEGLVWNYRVGAWSKWDTFDCVHACTWKGVYTRLGTLSAVTKESLTTGTTANVSLTTAWMKLAGLQGFTRVWAILLLLRWYSGALQAQIRYDYDDTVVDTMTFTHAEMGALDAAAGGRAQPKLHPSRQKCESIQIIFTETPHQSAIDGRGIEFISLALDCGVKRGANKNIAAAAKR